MSLSLDSCRPVYDPSIGENTKDEHTLARFAKLCHEYRDLQFHIT